MKKSILFLLINLSVYSQVGINTVTPHESSVLDVYSNDKGVLIPRISIVDLNSPLPVTNPIESLLVYNTNNAFELGFYFWNGSKWIPISNNYWVKNGNNIYNSNVDFVGIGTVSPTAKLHIEKSSFATSDETLRIVDGNQASGKVLTSDNFGNASWQNLNTLLMASIKEIPIPICNNVFAGFSGSFNTIINGVNTLISYQVLQKQTASSSSNINGVMMSNSPVISEKLQIKYDFSPPLPFNPESIIFSANNNTGYPDVFIVNYSNKSQNTITVNIARTDLFSSLDSDCWQGQFYFDVFITN